VIFAADNISNLPDVELRHWERKNKLNLKSFKKNVTNIEAAVEALSELLDDYCLTASTTNQSLKEQQYWKGSRPNNLTTTIFSIAINFDDLRP
jgi:hypothetical protein